MNAPFRLFGADMSAFALKMRAYLDFKGVRYDWTPRTNANQPAFAHYAKLPLSPLLVDAEDNVLQDTSAMIAQLERDFPEPSVTPADKRLAFLALVLEDYCDEWLNKTGFHYRWSKAEDAAAAAARTIAFLYEGEAPPQGAAEAVAERMAGRLHHAGSSEDNAPVIEASFSQGLTALGVHFDAHGFFLGGRPCAADFALYGQVRQWLADPTPQALVRAYAPSLEAWAERVAQARPDAEFSAFDALRPALVALLSKAVGPAYLTWARSNRSAFEDDAAVVRVTIGDDVFEQKAQRMAAKAFAGLMRAYLSTGEDGPDAALIALLDEAGCLDAFAESADTAEGSNGADPKVAQSNDDDPGDSDDSASEES